MVSKGTIYTHLLEPDKKDEDQEWAGFVHCERYGLGPNYSISKYFEAKDEAEKWLEQIGDLLDRTYFEIDDKAEHQIELKKKTAGE